MPKPDDLTRLHNMLDAARNAVQFTRGRSRSSLQRNKMLELALTRLLEIIGEAAKEISEDLRTTYPEIAWYKMSGMRNRLIHGYFDVDQEMVWETVTRELPPLIAQLENILKKRANNANS
jgi:uncharacterized protein with HEPN domain